jgi:hypothetical protein
MAPTNQAATSALIGQAQSKGQQLQNQYDTQSAQTQNQYQQTYNQANSAYQNLQNYNKQIANTNYGDQFKQAQQYQQGQLGYNPATTQAAAKNLTSSENIMAALPQATNQMGNYSGATAGQEAQNYTNMAGNVNAQMTNANNALQNQLGMYGAAAGAANQQTTQQLAGQQLASQNYQALYQNATSQMQTAGQVMTQVEGLQQQQGYLTAQQVAAYQGAYNGYITAKAAAESAAAQMLQANTYAQATKFSENQTTKEQQAASLSGLQRAGQGNAWVGQDGNLYVKAAGLAGGVVNVGPANSSTAMQALTYDPGLTGIGNPSVKGSSNAAQTLFNSVKGGNSPSFSPSIQQALNQSMSNQAFSNAVGGALGPGYQ